MLKEIQKGNQRDDHVEQEGKSNPKEQKLDD